jgi:hypothetical protein
MNFNFALKTLLCSWALSSCLMHNESVYSMGVHGEDVYREDMHGLGVPGVGGHDVKTLTSIHITLELALQRK